MSAQEFDEWIAFDSFEPIGARREDVLTAFIGSLLLTQGLPPERDPITPENLLQALPWLSGTAQAPQSHPASTEFDRLWAAHNND